MRATVNTDAGVFRRQQIGSFAFWIVSDSLKIKKSGMLKGEITSPILAEIRAIINALHILNCCGEEVSKVVVNTDCTGAIHFFNMPQSKVRKKYGKEWHHYCKVKIKGVEYDFRHVKAHTDTETSRRWVNDWCDKKCREELIKFVKQNK